MTCDYCRGVGACPRCWGRAAIDALAAENAALREAVVYARAKRGAAFDFDEWNRLVEHALRGERAPSALENEIAINSGLRLAIEKLREEGR